MDIDNNDNTKICEEYETRIFIQRFLNDCKIMDGV